uniref:Reverse transcriptase domain-containing protein n=1 Tax=Sphaeramia orbicularis TaxID=375764 RepID=A0A672ZQ03_9TELE
SDPAPFKETINPFWLRQGCPLSALLYVLYIEPLARSIRASNNIRGLKLPGGEILNISQYADDIILYLADDNSAQEVLKTLENFSCASGLKINKNKTYKFLGNGIGEQTLHLSCVGKALVVESDILPTLLHLANVFPMPFSIRKLLVKQIFNFFWGGYEYIKRDRKLDVLFFSEICLLLPTTYTHKCQVLLKFWLTIPFMFLTKWDNRTAKAEIIPKHFQYVVSLSKKWLEYLPVWVFSAPNGTPQGGGSNRMIPFD